MKATLIAMALSLPPTTPAELERSCTAQALRVWSVEQVQDRDGRTPDAQAAQWFMAGCRAGGRMAAPSALDPKADPTVPTRAGWGGLTDGR